MSRFDDITIDMVQKTRFINDSILWDNIIEISFWYKMDYITHCSKNSIDFNLKKFPFVEKEVEFTRFQVTDDRIKPTMRMTESILNFPTLQNFTSPDSDL